MTQDADRRMLLHIASLLEEQHKALWNELSVTERDWMRRERILDALCHLSKVIGILKKAS